MFSNFFSQNKNCVFLIQLRRKLKKRRGQEDQNANTLKAKTKSFVQIFFTMAVLKNAIFLSFYRTASLRPWSQSFLLELRYIRTGIIIADLAQMPYFLISVRNVIMIAVLTKMPYFLAFIRRRSWSQSSQHNFKNGILIMRTVTMITVLTKMSYFWWLQAWSHSQSSQKCHVSESL